MADAIDLLREQLREHADDQTKASLQRFFKEEVRLYGVRSADVGKISKRVYKIVESKPKTEIFDLCEQLWQSGMLEEAFVANNWAYSLRKQFEPDDFPIFERWVNLYVDNWAACDGLCTGTIGAFLVRYPVFVENLKQWCGSPNRWVRRAAAVSLINPAHDGQFKAEVFEIANRLLLDPDDMVQKGYGWMLKSLAAPFEDEVYSFILDHRASMPRTALRYAIEKMPVEKKREAMKKI